MKRWSFFLALVVTASACSTNQGGLPSPDDLVYWPPGRYELEASVQYREVMSDTESTVTDVYSALLIVTPNGSLILTSSSGTCAPPRPSEARRDTSQDRRRFECGTVTYYLWPEDDRLGGEIVASVQEQTRERGRCVRYYSGLDGRDRCVECGWTVTSRTTDKPVRLKILNAS